METNYAPFQERRRHCPAGRLMTTTLVPARADVKDFEFQLVQNELKKGDAVVVVRLVDKRTKKPVPNAVIFAKRIDMAPDAWRPCRDVKSCRRQHPASTASRRIFPCKAVGNSRSAPRCRAKPDRFKAS